MVARQIRVMMSSTVDSPCQPNDEICRRDTAVPNHWDTWILTLPAFSLCSQESAANVARVERHHVIELAWHEDQTSGSVEDWLQFNQWLVSIVQAVQYVQRRVTEWLGFKQNAIYCKDDVEQRSNSRLSMRHHWYISIDVYSENTNKRRRHDIISVNPNTRIWCCHRLDERHSISVVENLTGASLLASK